MSGYRRRIRLAAPAPGAVEAELEDDFHHFRVRLEHDGRRVTAIAGGAERFPWTTCGQATGPLAGLVGAPLAERSSAIAAHLPARANCTHLYDLAGLALAHRGVDRRYHVVVPDRVDGATTATLDRDGKRRLAWQVRNHTIVAPEPFAGRTLRGGGFIQWADATFGPDEAEAAIVLRRALAISYGRQQDLDAYHTAAELPFMTGTCFTFQAERMPVALRVKGSTRDQV
jgi:Protein of unknown function (DUF2889)